MNKKELEYFRDKLVSEQKTLEEELSDIGMRSPNNPNVWEARTSDMEVDSADENEVADRLEEYEENKGIVSKLESQLNDVKKALDKITTGKYGLCEVCAKPIEKERLEANPSAKISIKHGH